MGGGEGIQDRGLKKTIVRTMRNLTWSLMVRGIMESEIVFQVRENLIYIGHNVESYWPLASVKLCSYPAKKSSCMEETSFSI